LILIFFFPLQICFSADQFFVSFLFSVMDGSAVEEMRGAVRFFGEEGRQLWCPTTVEEGLLLEADLRR
jgi:hypothetical protein